MPELSNKTRESVSETGLDRIDTGIVLALQNNARLSNKQLAADVGLSPSACLERVRRLEARGVLRGYTAEVDPAALGIGLQAMAAIKLRVHNRETFASIIEHLLAQPEVTAIYELAGQDDLLVHLMCRDAAHLRDFMSDSLGYRDEHQQLVTSLVYEHHLKRGLPDLRAPEPEPAPKRQSRSKRRRRS